MASTCTSKTATVTGTDPNFVVTYKTNSTKMVMMLLKFTKSTDNLAVTVDIKNPSISSNVVYRMTKSADDGTIVAQSIALSATGNIRVPIPIMSSDKTIIANLTFAGTVGSDCVVDFVEE